MCICDIDEEQKVCRPYTSPIKEKSNIGFSRFQIKRTVGPNFASTMILMRPTEENNNEPISHFTARQATKVEYDVKQMKPCRNMCLIKGRATAIAILTF